MWLGFVLTWYSVVSNDVIRTLGRFLTYNGKHVSWWILWLYVGSILTVVLILGWFDPFGNMDYTYGIAYGRLDMFSMPEQYYWYFLLPPVVLLVMTRMGIPVSTTFMILTLFSLQDIPNDLGNMVSSVFDVGTHLGGMIQKSLMGYLVAFGAAIFIYFGISKFAERFFRREQGGQLSAKFWSVAQWCSTAFLWSQWLTQDLANIYVFLRGGAGMSNSAFLLSLLILLSLLALIFYQQGGVVKDVVRSKLYTADIRSSTFVDLLYGCLLYVFKEDYFGLWEAKLPMSTTWVFIGLLAGRELAIRWRLKHMIDRQIIRMLALDFGKVVFSLVVPIVLIFTIKLVGSS